MEKTYNLKITILVNGVPVYFGAPVEYDFKITDDGEIVSFTTLIGQPPVTQKIEIQIKNPTYVEPVKSES